MFVSKSANRFERLLDPRVLVRLSTSWAKKKLRMCESLHRISGVHIPYSFPWILSMRTDTPALVIISIVHAEEKAYIFSRDIKRQF